MGCTDRHRSRRHGLDVFIMTSFVIPVQKPTTNEVWKAKESSLLQHSFSLSVLKSGAHDVHWLAPEAQNSLPTHGALLTSQINPLCDTGSHGEGDCSVPWDCGVIWKGKMIIHDPQSSRVTSSVSFCCLSGTTVSLSGYEAVGLHSPGLEVIPHFSLKGGFCRLPESNTLCPACNSGRDFKIWP